MYTTCMLGSHHNYNPLQYNMIGIQRFCALSLFVSLGFPAAGTGPGWVSWDDPNPATGMLERPVTRSRSRRMLGLRPPNRL